MVELRGIAQSAENVAATDIADSADASDIEVTFVVSGDETYNAAYRVLIVPDAQAAAFTLAAAEAAPASRYTEVAAGSTSYQFALDAGQLDVNGDAIVEDEAYALFVLSVADPDFANENVLSAAGGVTLSSATSLQLLPAKVGRLWVDSRRLLQVEWSGSEPYDLSLYDVQGRSVLHLDGQQGSQSRDLSAYAAGVYIVRVQVAGRSYTQRVVVR